MHALAAELAAGIDPDISGAQAVELLAEVYAAGRQTDLLTCRLIERVDRSGAYAAEGAASTTAHVARESGETPSWASKRVQVGRALADRLPTTGKAWESGRLGLDHASVIDRATRDLDDDPDLVAVIDDALAGATPDASPKDLAGLAEHIRAQTAPEQTADKAARQYRAQKLSISQTLHGMWRIDGLLDPETGLLVSNAIAAFTRRPTAPDGTADPQPDPVLREPIGFRRALALAELCRQAIDHVEGCGSLGGSRHTIIAGIHLKDLQTGLGVGTATGGTTLGAAALRRLGCDTGPDPRRPRRRRRRPGHRTPHPHHPHRAPHLLGRPRRRLHLHRMRPAGLLDPSPSPHPVGTRRAHRPRELGPVMCRAPPPGARRRLDPHHRR